MKFFWGVLVAAVYTVSLWPSYFSSDVTRQNCKEEDVLLCSTHISRLSDLQRRLQIALHFSRYRYTYGGTQNGFGGWCIEFDLDESSERIRKKVASLFNRCKELRKVSPEFIEGEFQYILGSQKREQLEIEMLRNEVGLLTTQINDLQIGKN